MKSTGTRSKGPEEQLEFACKTLDLGLEGFSECPRNGPNSCSFAVPFGYGFLCRHPNLVEASPRHRVAPGNEPAK